MFELWPFVRYYRRHQHLAAGSQVCSRHTKRHASFSQGGDLGRRERLQMRKMRPKDQSDEKVLDPLSSEHSSGALEAIRLEPRGQTEPLRSLSGDTAAARSSQQ